MTRLHFNLSRILGDRGPTLAASNRALGSPNERDEGGGPGWFDSSWDLVHGLEVREGPLAGSGLAAECDEQPGARLVPAAAHRAFGDTLQLCDLGFAVAAEVTHLDEFGQFGIDGLEFA